MDKDTLTPKEKLRLKIAQSRLGRLPNAIKEENVEKAKAYLADLMKKAKDSSEKK